MTLGSLEIFLAVGVFAVVFAAMAIGVMFRREPLQGSCGGLGRLRDADGNSFCEACTEPCAELKREMRRHGVAPERIAELVPRSENCSHD